MKAKSRASAICSLVTGGPLLVFSIIIQSKVEVFSLQSPYGTIFNYIPLLPCLAALFLIIYGIITLFRGRANVALQGLAMTVCLGIYAIATVFLPINIMIGWGVSIILALFFALLAGYYYGSVSGAAVAILPFFFFSLYNFRYHSWFLQNPFPTALFIVVFALIVKGGKTGHGGEKKLSRIAAALGAGVAAYALALTVVSYFFDADFGKLGFYIFLTRRNLNIVANVMVFFLVLLIIKGIKRLIKRAPAPDFAGDTSAPESENANIYEYNPILSGEASPAPVDSEPARQPERGIYCPSCGERLPEGEDDICPACGGRV